MKLMPSASEIIKTLARLRANELLHFGFARIDLGNHARDGVAIDGILEREESFLIK